VGDSGCGDFQSPQISVCAPFLPQRHSLGPRTFAKTTQYTCLKGLRTLNCARLELDCRWWWWCDCDRVL
jgi:hypothetical protein